LEIVQYLVKLWGKVDFLKRPVLRGIVLLKDEELAHDSIRVHKPNGISIGAAVFAQMIAVRSVSLCFTMGRPFAPSKLPLAMVNLDPYLIRGSWAHPSPQPKRYLDQFGPFAGLV